MARKKKKLAGYDLMLIIPTLLLLGIGLVAIYSASSLLAEHRMGDGYYYLKRQAIFCALGITVMLLARNIPTEVFRRLAYPALGVTCALLGLLLVPQLGFSGGGASRWLRLGGFSFQPSELAKVSLILYLAYSMAKKGPEMTKFSKGFLPHILVTVTFMALIIMQPDMGTCVILGCWLLIILFVGGARLVYLLTTVLLFVPVAAWLVYTASYRLKRWWAFIDPWEDPQGLGFQIIHSFLAFGSGGIFGVGLGNSKEKLFYLPEPHTDFILSIVGEELGLIGTGAVIVLFALLIMRGIKIALTASDLYSSYLAMGVTTLFGLQVIINMGVVTGLLPTKGLTLPLVSYGGSSLVTSLLGIGILLHVSARR